MLVSVGSDEFFDSVVPERHGTYDELVRAAFVGIFPIRHTYFSCIDGSHIVARQKV